jgi:hypothetical protein
MRTSYFKPQILTKRLKSSFANHKQGKSNFVIFYSRVLLVRTDAYDHITHKDLFQRVFHSH